MKRKYIYIISLIAILIIATIFLSIVNINKKANNNTSTTKNKLEIKKEKTTNSTTIPTTPTTTSTTFKISVEKETTKQNKTTKKQTTSKIIKESNQNTTTSKATTQTTTTTTTTKSCTPKKFDFSFFIADFETMQECEKVGETYMPKYSYTCNYADDDCGTTYYWLYLHDLDTNKTYYNYKDAPMP